MSNPKIKGDVILCHDCRQIGYIVLEGGGYILPPGWKLAWIRWKPLYICGDCGRKRLQQAKRLLNLR